MNPEEKKVGLSIRAVGEEGTRQDVEHYKQPAKGAAKSPASSSGSGASTTLGELVNWKRASNDQN
jgi:small subunit ribosomal protein S1